MGLWDVAKIIGEGFVESNVKQPMEKLNNYYEQYVNASDDRLKKIFTTTSDTKKKMAIARILRERGYNI